ncbi:NAD-dependent epimerase/dehydratase [Neocallimastix lanati (nom. inval.)]|uniref:UDP-glucuronic acid decarboxylase 1 n=1 Tax=Neocallimastix californiae TaxID=1754190 RepID=A0A1Y1YPN9_9FUNG|nr:NAD-dependent epimerase/dehydratase [Neocallimastix sp. JGI-2020a]ORX99979.1 NAD-dependent epimerase/dehydratase [Neocallimastix californiae]|eukprot:ORX99979.1 NAD-dependent epimerase/dehydratase [Neocallimastix californiae]
MSKTILITGGAGFIGSNLCRRLLKDDNKVICVDNLYTGQMRNIKPLMTNKNFKFINHNIIEPLTIEEKLDQIYNLACPASPPHYQKDPLFTINTCFIGTTNMLNLARINNCKMLQASTSEVYGDPLEHPQKETYRGHVNCFGIRSCYDEGKRSAETLCFNYINQFGVNVKIIRIFNTYGPYMAKDDGRVITNFVNQALYDQDETIYGDGSQTRSFQYIDDLIEAMIRVMDTDDTFHGPINLGNPNEFTIKELAEIILELIKESKSKMVYKELPMDDPCKRRPDISLAKEKLKWEPVIQLREGLQKTIDYFKEIKDIGQK